MLNIIELFAGVGGFRIGLEGEGLKVVWGNQWEPARKRQDAFNCYKTRFKGCGVHSNEDISKVDTGKIGAADILVGGFPCQDYSVARSTSKEKGIEGKKGVLFWEIIRLLHEIKPKYVLLENVDRLLKAPGKQRGRDFSIMLASLRDEGYNVEWRVLNAADYGNAQRRRRVFIFASKEELPYNKSLNNETPQNILHYSGFFVSKFPIKEETSVRKKPHSFLLNQDVIEISDTISINYLNAGIMRNGEVYTEELDPIQEEPILLGDVLESKVDEKYYISPREN